MVGVGSYISSGWNSLRIILFTYGVEITLDIYVMISYIV